MESFILEFSKENNKTHLGFLVVETASSRLLGRCSSELCTQYCSLCGSFYQHTFLTKVSFCMMIQNKNQCFYFIGSIHRLEEQG